MARITESTKNQAEILLYACFWVLFLTSIRCGSALDASSSDVFGLINESLDNHGNVNILLEHENMAELFVEGLHGLVDALKDNPKLQSVIFTLMRRLDFDGLQYEDELGKAIFTGMHEADIVARITPFMSNGIFIRNVQYPPTEHEISAFYDYIASRDFYEAHSGAMFLHGCLKVAAAPKIDAWIAVMNKADLLDPQFNEPDFFSRRYPRNASYVSIALAKFMEVTHTEDNRAFAANAINAIQLENVKDIGIFIHDVAAFAVRNDRESKIVGYLENAALSETKTFFIRMTALHLLDILKGGDDGQARIFQLKEWNDKWEKAFQTRTRLREIDSD